MPCTCVGSKCAGKMNCNNLVSFSFRDFTKSSGVIHYGCSVYCDFEFSASKKAYIKQYMPK